MNDFYMYHKEFSSLVSEIESNNCSSIANIIRKLRQLEAASGADSSSSQVLSKFTRYLNSEISIRDGEIEQFCGTYYQNFIESIKELMRIQQEASDLRQSCCGEARKAVIGGVARVRNDCQELARCHAVLANIDAAIANLELCLPVFDQYLKADRCIGERRFYPALKALNQLEVNQLSRVINKFAFSETLQNEIPAMRAKIQTASRDEIKDFLETVRRHSARLGRGTMRQVAEKTGMVLAGLEYAGVAGNQALETAMMAHKDTARKTLTTAKMRVSKARAGKNNREMAESDTFEEELQELISLDKSTTSWYHEDPSIDHGHESGQDDDEITNVEDLVDFGPVYRCLHIHSVLGNRHEFEKCYRNQRKRQCTLLLTLAKQETIRNYCDFFSGIVGFFVVEDYIRYSEISIVTRNYLDELWSHTLSRVGDFVQANSKNIESIDILLDLKNYNVLFGKTMRSLGFNVAGFKDFYDVLRNQYQNLLGREYQEKFQAVFAGEDYTSITVATPDDMEIVIEMYPSFLSPDIDLQPYPKSLSFSWMVPRIYQLVREHIKKSKQFSDNLELSQTELEDQLHHTTNKLFEALLNPLLLGAIKDSGRQINRLIQLAVNMDELESACHSLQTFIQSLVGVVYHSEDHQTQHGKQFPGETRSRLHAFSTFKDLHSKIEDSIFNAMFSKINDIFDVNDYMDLNVQSDSIKNSPSKKMLASPNVTKKIQNSEVVAVDTSILSSLPPASEFITDAISYLTSTFESFTNLPVRIAQTVCFVCCNHLHDKLHSFLNQQDRLTVALLQQLASDTRALKEFTRNIPVAGVSPQQLLLKFEDLRQIFDLVLLHDWDNYIASFKTDKCPYDRVAPQSAISILEKCRKTDSKFVNFFKTFKKNNDTKEDEIIRKLRELR